MESERGGKGGGEESREGPTLLLPHLLRCGVLPVHEVVGRGREGKGTGSGKSLSMNLTQIEMNVDNRLPPELWMRQ